MEVYKRCLQCGATLPSYNGFHKQVIMCPVCKSVLLGWEFVEQDISKKEGKENERESK